MLHAHLLMRRGCYFSLDSIKAGSESDVVTEFGRLNAIYEVAFAGKTYVCGRVRMFWRQLEETKKRRIDVERLGSFNGRDFELLTVDTNRADPLKRSFQMLSAFTGQVILAPTDAALQRPAATRLQGNCYLLPCRPVVKNDSLGSVLARPAAAGAAARAPAGAAAVDAAAIDAAAVGGPAPAVAAPVLASAVGTARAPSAAVAVELAAAVPAACAAGAGPKPADPDSRPFAPTRNGFGLLS
jgi:hypothetical protein